MKGRENPGLLEDPAGLEDQVDRLELAAGAVDKDDRAGDLRPGDLLGDHPALADMVQNDPEAELPREPQDRHDIVVPMGVVMDHPASLEHLDETLEPQIPGRLLLGIVERGRQLVSVLSRPDELRPHQRC